MTAENIQRTAYGVVDLAGAFAPDQLNIVVRAYAASIYARIRRYICQQFDYIAIHVSVRIFLS